MEFPYLKWNFSGPISGPEGPYIPITLLNGIEKVKTEGLLDTGADTSVIVRSLADSLGLPLNGDVKVFGGYGGREKAREAKVTVFLENNGEMFRHEIIIYIVADGKLSIPLILGRDGIFQHFRITFDERARTVVLDRYLCK